MKYLLSILFAFLFSASFAQTKKQEVTIKPTTGTLIMDATEINSFLIQVNQKVKVVHDTILKRETIYLHDTTYVPRLVYICPPTDTVTYLKDYKTFEDGWNAAAKTRSGILQAPEKYILNGSATNSLSGDVIVKGPATIISNFGTKNPGGEVYSIRLGEGKHTFDGIDFSLGTNTDGNWGGTIQTQEANIKYDNTFTNCRFVGEWRNNYQSSSGAPRSRTEFTDCSLYATNINIQYYSQLGSKDLIMKRCTIESKESHNIYSHYNNYDIDSLVCINSGKLAFNSYQTAQDLPTKPTFQKFNRCFNAPGARSLAWGTDVMWHFATNSGTIELSNSDVGVYEWKGFPMEIYNTTLHNYGNGAGIPEGSVLDSVRGTIWLNPNSTINNSHVDELRIYGKDIVVFNTEIDWLYINDTKYYQQQKRDEKGNWIKQTISF